MPDQTPSFLVLLAAYNGAPFLQEQVDSILRQRDVQVRILISVDRSTDGTERLVDRLCQEHELVTALPHGQRFGGAAPNFYRLLAEADLTGSTHVALADQDDVWFDEKLKRAQEQLVSLDATCYSSNVLAWSDQEGSRRLVDKAQPQREWDHLFSSAGPGCTYVLTTPAAQTFAEWLRPNLERALAVEYHDWLLYAWMRRHGQSWHIDRQPSMLYRQHGANQLGANQGLAALTHRVQGLRSNWYLQQVLAVAMCVDASDEPPIRLVTAGTRKGLLRLALRSRRLRRSPREALALGLMLVVISPTRRSGR